MSYKNPLGLDIRGDDVVIILLGTNPKKGEKNKTYWNAVRAAIAGGHRTVDEIVAFCKSRERYAGLPIRAEIRHNVGRGWYELRRASMPELVAATPDLENSSAVYGTGDDELAQAA